MILTDRYPFGASSKFDDFSMNEISERIKNDQVFVYPTETIYGIGGRSDRDSVAHRIMEIKGRSKNSPFIILAANRSMFEPLALRFTAKAEALAKQFWPGNITLVLPSIHNPQGIGVRLSNHPFMVSLGMHCDIAIFSTSANFSGKEYVYDSQRIFSTIGKSVDFIVDAGNIPASKPSTVVKIDENDAVSILREGIVQAEQIFSICK